MQIHFYVFNLIKDLFVILLSSKHSTGYEAHSIIIHVSCSEQLVGWADSHYQLKARSQ